MDKTTAKPKRRTAQSLAAEAAFRARVEDLGGTVLEPSWLGALKPHRVRCAAGHDCTPKPNNVQQGWGICRACVGQDPKAAEAAFRARVEGLGGTVLGDYVNNRTPVRVRCAAGHDCSPRPDGVRDGGGICRTCYRRDPEAVWGAFRQRVAAQGGVVLEPSWLGANTPHRVRCSSGHEAAPRPATVQQGGGICRACSGRDPKAAEAAFRARVEGLGGTVLEPSWLGANTPHRVRCADGHEVTPHPGSVQQGHSICRVCAAGSEAAWGAFRQRVAAQGGVVLEPSWMGHKTPHRVRCSSGHEVTPSPANVGQGGGICRICRVQHDAVYLVMDPVAKRCKFGITSGDSRPRLSAHRRGGYTRLLLAFEGLPEGVAWDVESGLRRRLPAIGHQPVQGFEHMPLKSLALLMMELGQLRGHAVTVTGELAVNDMDTFDVPA
ncbi:hypothetical protein ACH3XX_20100 [Streptomyces scabiei]|uniref:hypothetical protein n=1 Tax=Streptomyces scabiei TaxID=1930 RepID=UPI00378D2B0C